MEYLISEILLHSHYLVYEDEIHNDQFYHLKTLIIHIVSHLTEARHFKTLIRWNHSHGIRLNSWDLTKSRHRGDSSIHSNSQSSQNILLYIILIQF